MCHLANFCASWATFLSHLNILMQAWTYLVSPPPSLRPLRKFVYQFNMSCVNRDILVPPVGSLCHLKILCSHLILLSSSQDFRLKQNNPQITRPEPFTTRPFDIRTCFTWLYIVRNGFKVFADVRGAESMNWYFFRYQRMAPVDQWKFVNCIYAFTRCQRTLFRALQASNRWHHVSTCSLSSHISVSPLHSIRPDGTNLTAWWTEILGYK